ncbi:MAG: hypothetical protein MSIBF_02490 [Candidatus Altiarchaeales archaeon IMC4]|nr:MAG: hypothetical protein MSIBF_02490 [Candidatus Altiarchaeales archaeon IMC4]
MESTCTRINLPEAFFSVMKVKNVDRFVGETIAVELYREGKISLGKAKELTGARNKWEMLLILDKRGIPIDYSAEDAQKDVKTLRNVVKNKK